jgi:hypothetical protein
LGAALAIHDSWNTHKIPGNLIELKYFAKPQTSLLVGEDTDQ